jgi:hypothetical protein
LPVHVVESQELELELELEPEPEPEAQLPRQIQMVAAAVC